MSSFFREVDCAGKILRIKQLYIGDVGCVVWDAALVLAKFLESPLHFPAVAAANSRGGRGGVGVASEEVVPYWKGKKVVELGSGTGVVGLAAAALGADVFITDLPEFVELMAANVELNSEALAGSAVARTLKWGESISLEISEPRPDIVLMSDVVYYQDSLEGLLKTLLELCSKETTILMSYEERQTGDKPQIEKNFFQMMKSKFQRIIVPFKDLDDTFRSPDIHIIKFKLM